MSSKPDDRKDPAESPPERTLKERAGSPSVLDAWRAGTADTPYKRLASREPLFEQPAASQPRQSAGATLCSPPWQRGEAGAVLERELLLVNAEEDALEPPGWKGIRVLALVFLFAAIVGAGLFGFHQIEEGWKKRIDQLQSRIGYLEDDNSLRQQALEKVREETALELNERRKENQTLAAMVERTLGELQGTVEELRRLREEKKKLSADYERLKTQSLLDSLEVLSHLCPPWLREATKGSERVEE